LALEIGIVGLRGSGKTTLFNALTGAGVEAQTYLGGAPKPNVGVAPVVDDRLPRVASVVGSARTTPAAIRVVDIPGSDAALMGGLRQVDALVAVLDAFNTSSDPQVDLETVKLELLVADRDHVERRLERVSRQAKSGDAALRRDVAELQQLLAHLEAGNTLEAYGESLLPELQPLTTKTLLPVANGPSGIDCKLEAELAELDPAEAASFREGPSALEEVVRRVFDELATISFFTANEREARAWNLRSGVTALQAAAAIHTDMAQGFIRCEVVHWSDLVESGSRAEAARRGLQRLEGKDYPVEDGDLLSIRFSPPAPRGRSSSS